MKPIPEHGPCFVCGTENPKGIGSQWFTRDDGSVFCKVTLTLAEQGPPGHVHGGASAALLDEAMGAAVWQAGHMVMVVNLNLDFRRPVPLGAPVEITAVVTERDGRKVYTRGEIRLPGGQVAVVGKGIFVEAGQLFTKFIQEHGGFQG